MPPLEAATLGNIVIGYTGEAGKEYWNSPIFRKVEQGDILRFTEEINLTTKRKVNYSLMSAQRKKLLKKYSKDNQKKKLLQMLNIIKKYY